MEDEGIPGAAGNQNQVHSVPEQRELCFRVCTTPLSELRRTAVTKMRVGEPAKGYYLLLRTLKPAIKGWTTFEFGPSNLVQVEDHFMYRIHFYLLAHVHLKSEEELEDLLPVNTVIVLKEPSLLACPKEQFAVLVGSPSDFVLVGRSHVLYKDVEALGWRPKLEDGGTDDSALAWKAKGDTLFENGEFDKALDVYLVAHTIGADDVTNFMIEQNLARVYFELGYYERAIKHCHKVLESNPINETALCLTGLVHYQLRQFTEARNYFEMTLSVSPTNRTAAAGLDHCEERFRETAGNVDIPKLFRACITDSTTPIELGTFSRNVSFELGPDNERGMYVTKDLRPGTLILVEKPIVGISVPRSPSERGLIELMRTAFKVVMKNPRSVLRKLYGLPGGANPIEEEKRIFCDEVNELEPILDVRSLYRLIKQNILVLKNFIVQDGPCSYLVYELASRFRHSCLSNCSFDFYNNVVAIRTCSPVSKGDELFLRLCGNDLSFSEKKVIFERMGFECNCYLCYLDKMESTEVHKLRDELKASFYTQLSTYGCVPDWVELDLLPIVQELELAYKGRQHLRQHLFFVYCEMAKVVDPGLKDWKRTAERYVELGLQSVGLSLRFLLSLADEVHPQIPERVLMPEVLFQYAAIMVNLEFPVGRPDVKEKWMKVLFVLERVYTGGSVEMLVHRFPRFKALQSSLAAFAQYTAGNPSGSLLG